ncbi:MAG: endonuclease/exonuclease/phosphatase family protein [Planctomycetaceae bacterium]|nr:endonuclease/exonuclease/phosphatase family protein [Planctomycetaceae bacterium]
MSADLETSAEPRNERQGYDSSIGIKLIKLLGAIAILGSVVSGFANYHWVPDFISQATVQFAILLLPAMIVAWCQKRVVVGSFCLVLLAWHLIKIVPYYLVPTDGIVKTTDESILRLAVFNVLRTNEEFEATLESILATEADFMYLMEVQPKWRPYLEAIRDRYPYQEVRDDYEYLGVAFLSRKPWRELNVLQLGSVSNPSIDVRIPMDGAFTPDLHLIATHPLPPFGEVLTQSRDQQLATLIGRFQDGEAQILCGDFNLSPWSPRFARLCRQGGLLDASFGFGIAPTLTPLPTIMGGIKVDHILRNSMVRVHDYRVLPSAQSDHGVVVLDFSIPPD